MASPLESGEVIYMKGTDVQDNRIPAVLNDLRSDAPLGCVNCHRESGFGSSESGQTIPPVSWHFLGRNQPEDDTSRFYHIQNKRKAYDADSFFRLLTTGVNSNGNIADGLMPKYALTRQQSDDLIEYLKTIHVGNDPGVDADVMRFATIVDSRLPQQQRDQHIAFLKGLFEMKNSLSRGELKRKMHSPIQKAPQYESYRSWELVVWELPEDPALWPEVLAQLYEKTPVFTIIRPTVKKDYGVIAGFCTENKISCFFPSAENLPPGDFYNFVFRNRPKQIADYLNKKSRAASRPLLYVDAGTNIQTLDDSMTDLPLVTELDLEKLQNQYDQYCLDNSELLIKIEVAKAGVLEQLNCSTRANMDITILTETSASYQAIADYIKQNTASRICWASDYDKVLNRNFRGIRVNAMVNRFKIENPDEEELAKTLLTYGLLTDSLHKMAGNFSRVYMLEIIEHMLNSFLNYTYFSTISGAPYQRYIVGPLNDYCPAGARK